MFVAYPGWTHSCWLPTCVSHLTRQPCLLENRFVSGHYILMQILFLGHYTLTPTQLPLPSLVRADISHWRLLALSKDRQHAALHAFSRRRVEWMRVSLALPFAGIAYTKPCWLLACCCLWCADSC
jgi:hypothetical protein